MKRFLKLNSSSIVFLLQHYMRNMNGTYYPLEITEWPSEYHDNTLCRNGYVEIKDNKSYITKEGISLCNKILNLVNTQS